MCPPVARIADERQPRAPLPASDQERTAPDGCARLRIDDAVAPDALEILAGKGMPRKDVAEECAPGRRARAKNHPHRLRVDGAHALDELDELSLLGVQLGLPGDSRPQGEDEVPRCDRHAVAPPGARMDSEREDEWRFPREGRARESRPKRGVGTDVEGLLENRLRDEVDGREAGAARIAPREQDVEAGRLGGPEAELNGAAHPRRCLHRTSRCRRRSHHGNGEQYGDRASAHVFLVPRLPDSTPGLQRPTMSSGRTGTRVRSRPVASRSAATMAAVETTVGGSPTPLTP